VAIKNPIFAFPFKFLLSLMRITISVLIAFFSIASQAQVKSGKKHVTLFTVGDKVVYTDEFVHLYSKNSMNKTAGISEQNVNEYLDLLVNFKLKIAEAHYRGLDTTQKFNKEFKTYREELKRPYRAEPDVLDKLTKDTYQRLTEEVKASHILIMLKPDASPSDTLAAHEKISQARNRVLNGESFDKVAGEVSEDPSAKYNFGSLGYFTAMQMVYPFEEAAYRTKPNEISSIVRTQFGYHILKVFGRQPARGEVEVSHILLRTGTPDDSKVKGKIFDVYDQLKKGRNWDEVCKEFSEDAATKNGGGKLRPFGIGALASVPEFEATAFALKNAGEISDPFQSNIGWHIVKLEKKIPLLPFAEMEPALKRKLGRDERLQISKQALSEKRKKEYSFLEDQSIKNKIFEQADSNLIQGKWHPHENVEWKAQRLFSIQDKPTDVLTFVKYIKANQTPVAIAPEAYMKQLYENFVEDKIGEAEEEKLQQDHPDFKNLITEYREGILLFDIMENEVWNKASEDSTGQKSFYEMNKTKYQAGDRVEARIFTATDKTIIESIIEKVNKGDTLSNTDLKKFKSIQPFRLYERKDSKVIDRITWTKGLHQAELDGQFYLVEVKRLAAPGIKSFEEARASVISDYQDHLEKEWLTVLKKKFPVKINTKGKKLVLEQLTKKS
jgi:peptidyl-prolyl cis-trans isomerase SurA